MSGGRYFYSSSLVVKTGSSKNKTSTFKTKSKTGSAETKTKTNSGEKVDFVGLGT